MSKVVVVVAVMVLMAAVVKGQQPGTGQCSPTMMNTVGPCMSFLTNSSANASSPSSDCCNSLRSLTTGGMGCLCLIVTGAFPFTIPINRTTAVSLPQSCNMPRVPLQCKANVAPAAAPGPSSLGQAMSPSPVSAPVAPESEPPQSETSSLLPPQSPATGGGSSRPSITPSSSAAFPCSYSFSPSLVFFILGLSLLKFF